MANNNSNEADNKKGLRIVTTIFAYLFFIVTAIAVLPTVLPMIFGYRTHNVNYDVTGQASQTFSVVYTDKSEAADLVSGNIVALETNEGKKVKVSYVDANNTETKTITTRTKDGITEEVSYDKVVGHVVAKTPFVGILTQLCFTIPGIIFVAVIFVIAVVLAIVSNKMVAKKTE